MKKTKLTALLLAAGMLLPILGGCAAGENPVGGDGSDTDEPVFVDYSASGLGSASPAESAEMSKEFVQASSAFGFELLGKTAQSGNMMISPVSVLYALGMTSLGSAGNTRTQMEKTLFGGISAEDAAKYFRGFADTLPDSEKAKVTIANSIWLNQLQGRFSVNAEFLSDNASYYGADVFGLPFNMEALERVNGWISDKTDKMIPQMLDDIAPDALMMLVNTVLFDAKWRTEYTQYQVSDQDFTSYDGTVTKRETLSSSEYGYFELGKGAGFLKPYAEKYSFVGILPNEGEDVFKYAQSIDGKAFVDAVTGASRDKVLVRIPSFTFDSSASLEGILAEMGMSDAFSGSKADFSAMGECADGGNIHISRVLHKTRIELTRSGTKAAAATVVEMKATSAAPTAKPKQIYLDRPFVFAIVENETGLPLFCGVVSELK